MHLKCSERDSAATERLRVSIVVMDNTKYGPRDKLSLEKL
jgi:hypothetical protein